MKLMTRTAVNIFSSIFHNAKGRENLSRRPFFPNEALIDNLEEGAFFDRLSFIFDRFFHIKQSFTRLFNMKEWS